MFDPYFGGIQTANFAIARDRRKASHPQADTVRVAMERAMQGLGTVWTRVLTFATAPENAYLPRELALVTRALHAA